MTLNCIHPHCSVVLALSSAFPCMILLSLIILATCHPDRTQFNCSLLCRRFWRPIGGIWSNGHHNQLTYCPPGGRGTVLHSYNSLIFLYSLMSSVLGRDETSLGVRGLSWVLLNESNGPRRVTVCSHRWQHFCGSGLLDATRDITDCEGWVGWRGELTCMSHDMT